jgi:hypothetical protein
MSEAFAIVCRACGAPQEGGELSGAMRCAHCGTSTPLDAATASRLRRHAAHVRRADQKVRAVVREHVIAGLLPQMAGKARSVAVGATLGGFAGLLVLALGPIALSAWLGPSFEPYFVGALIGGLLLGTLVLIGAIALAIAYGVRVGIAADQTASAVARSCATRTQTTRPTRCSNCGGFASMVVVGDAASLPCPYCRAPLVGTTDDATRAAMDAVVAEWQATGDQRLDRARFEAGLARPRVTIAVPGFTKRGGIYEGLFGRVPVWAYGDLSEHGLVLRVEALSSTPLDGAVWFLPRGAAEAHVAAMRSFGLRAPERRQALGPELDARFEVLADATVDASRVAAHPAVRALLAGAGPGESVSLDEAGACCWSMMPAKRLLWSGYQRFFPARGDALARAVAAL